MAFTAQELDNVAATCLDWYIKGPAFSQTIQDKPLLKALVENKKNFPGGKGLISIPVKGDYTTTVQGYTHNDTVSYANPANVKRVTFPWKELHSGIAVSFTELKEGGITVTDTTFGKEVSSVSDSEMIQLTNLFKDKLEDESEGYARGKNKIFWLDGTQDPKVPAGVLSMVIDNATSGVTGGLDRSINSWWRNRSFVGGSKITSSPTNQTLTIKLRSELRQLKRFAPNFKPMMLAGSTFLDLLNAEVQAKGNYTLSGFSKGTDIGGFDDGDITLRGLGKFEYDPTLDDLGYPDRLYILDMNAIKLMPMEGEEDRSHNPARPYNQYSMYRSQTWTGGMVCQQLNSSGVYQTA